MNGHSHFSQIKFKVVIIGRDSKNHVQISSCSRARPKIVERTILVAENASGCPKIDEF